VGQKGQSIRGKHKRGNFRVVVKVKAHTEVERGKKKKKKKNTNTLQPLRYSEAVVYWPVLAPRPPNPQASTFAARLGREPQRKHPSGGPLEGATEWGVVGGDAKKGGGILPAPPSLGVYDSRAHNPECSRPLFK